MVMQKIRMDNPRAVQRLLNRTINQLLADEIDCEKARVLGYLCSVLLKANEVEELDDRMSAIELRLEERKAI